jgi:hypothetical protein
MGATKCTALTIEKECDDLVGAISGGEGLQCDGSLIVLTS